MLQTQDRDPIAATRRVSADDAKRAADDDHGAATAIETELNLQLWDVRFAAVLNTMEIARAHGEHRDGQGPQVERVLADLADDHEDENCVDHVHVYVHAVTVPPGTQPRRRPTGGTPG